MVKKSYIYLSSILVLIFSCQEKVETKVENLTTGIIQPTIVTEPANYDTDDPAIWVNKDDPSKSLILGTDKGKKTDATGGIIVYDLNGKVIKEKCIQGLFRANNVDVEYGLILNGKPTDIAVVTERAKHQIRIFSLPDMKPVDNGGIPVFENEELNQPMGISLFKRPLDGAVFSILSRKKGPTDGTYLWQYLLEDDGTGNIKAKLVRKFGKFSGKKEIEAIAIDDELGYIYYCDERIGIRKYYADPDKGNEELVLFATKHVSKDREGISIFSSKNGKGYILLSDQGANKFHIYSREGSENDPNNHKLLKIVELATIESDGNEIISMPLNDVFSSGMFIAMSEKKIFHFYKWEDIVDEEFLLKNN